jgi:hypothetical protein
MKKLFVYTLCLVLVTLTEAKAQTQKTGVLKKTHTDRLMAINMKNYLEEIKKLSRCLNQKQTSALRTTEHS